MSTRKITYKQQGDYLLPDLKLPSSQRLQLGYGDSDICTISKNITQ